MIKFKLSDKFKTLGTFTLYTMIGVTALLLCINFFKAAIPEYKEKKYYDATITDIYYTDSEGMVSDEYIEFWEQHVIIEYLDGDEVITDRLYHQDENWEIGQSVQVYWDNGKLKDKATIWERPLIVLYIGILFVLAGGSYFIDFMKKKTNKVDKE